MNRRPWVEWRWLPVAILLLGFLLRVIAWDQAPPGLTHDEAAHLLDAQRIWDGFRPIYLTTAYGREPLYDYVSAPLVGLLGASRFTGRLASAWWGLGLLALTYAWAKRAFDRRTALVALALMSFSFWTLATSRQILRSTSMPVLLTAAILCYWSAVFGKVRKRWLWRFGAAGLLLGLSFYTYMPARITWLAPALISLSLAVLDRPRWRAARRGTVWMLAVMLVVALPLLIFLARHPELEVRVDELAAPLRAMLAGDWHPLWIRIRETILLFSHRGDLQSIYNIPGVPLLPPLLAGSFYAGLFLAAARLLDRRTAAHRLLLIWLLLGITPALMTGLESSSLRAIAAQPAVYVLAALPLAALLSWAAARPGAALQRGLPVLLGLGGLILLLTTLRAYLVDWAQASDTRVAYHAHLVGIAEYLDDSADASATTISSLYPGPWHDPLALEMLLRRQDLEITWSDARSALAFPPAGRARLVYPAEAPLDSALEGLLGSGARLVAELPLRAGDLSPWFRVVDWSPQQAIGRLPLTLTLSVPFGDKLALRGFALQDLPATAGGTLDVITYWQPLSVPPADIDLVLFTHLLAGGQVVAQQDRLDVPPVWWKSLGLFAQLHRLMLPADLPLGRYDLEVGVFVRGDGNPRLSITAGTEVGRDRFLLPAVEVR